MLIIEVQCLELIIYAQFVMQISSSGIFFFFFKIPHLDRHLFFYTQDREKREWNT